MTRSDSGVNKTVSIPTYFVSIWSGYFTQKKTIKMGRYCLLVWTLLADEAISFGAHTKKSRISLTPRRSWLDNLEAWEAGQHDKHDVLHGSLEDEITINSLLYKRGVDVSQIPVFSSGHEALDHEAFVFSSRPTRLKARFGQTLLAERSSWKRTKAT